MRLLLLFFLAFLPVHLALGEEQPWYQIELVIFERIGLDEQVSETWPDDPGEALVEPVLELIPQKVADRLDEREKQDAALDTGLGEPSQPEADRLPDDLSDSEATAAPGEASLPPFSEESVDETAVEQPRITERPFVLLPSETFGMRGAASRLRRSKNYRVLLHSAWRQPVQVPGEATPVHIHSDVGSVRAYYENIAARHQKNVDEPATQEAAPDETGRVPEEPIDDTVLGEPAKPLDGTVAVTVSRYLHLNADLIYRKEVTIPVERVTPPLTNAADQPIIVIREGVQAPLLPAANAEPDLAIAEIETTLVQAFRLATSRRMRSKEIHYLDHPLFGALALITPYEGPTSDRPDDTQNPTATQD